MSLPGGFPFLSLVLLVGGGATASLGVIGYRRRETPGARAFSLLAGAMAFYTLLYAISLPFGPGPLRTALGAIQWFGLALVPVTWFLFALEYSGRPEYLRRRNVVLLTLIPALAVGGAVAQALPVADGTPVALYGELFYTSTSSTDWLGHTFISHDTGPLYQLYIGYAYLCFLGGVGMLLEFVARYDRLYQEQALSIVLGGLFPFVGNVLAVIGLEPIMGLDLLPFLVPLTAILFANAVFRHELFDFTPATRRKGESKIVEEMRDAVVVVDDSNRIVNVNDAACDAFGVTKADVFGDELESALEVVIPPGNERFEVTFDGTVYEVTVSPVLDRFDSVIGRTLAFRDITDHRDDEQRLSVLNRVLRHNLRTEVNVITGYASMASRELPEEHTAIATEIETAAGTLDDLGQKAREVERIMSRGMDGTATYELAELLQHAIDAVDAVEDDGVGGAGEEMRGSGDGCDVAGSYPHSVRLEIDAVVFEAVVRDLLDAVAHYGPKDAAPTIAPSVTDGDLTLSVQPAGDGIPAEEYEVVLRGEETPLDHASGLSLWLVKWGVRRLDGTVTFDDDGEIVLTFPDCVVDGHSDADPDPASDRMPTTDPVRTTDPVPASEADAPVADERDRRFRDLFTNDPVPDGGTDADDDTDGVE